MKTTRKILIVDMPDGDELCGAYGWKQVGGNLLKSELVYYAAKEITPPSTVQKGGTEMSKQEEFKQWLLGYSGVKSLPENFDYELAQFVNEAIAEHEAKQWKPYPEERPEIGKICLIQTNINKSILIAEYKGGLWVSNGIGYRYEVIAFRELPEPYQPKQEGGEDV